jgi:predicted metalloprotease with PDZ domain
MNDTMSFTQMSANVLQQPYKDQYINVYPKGALIGMCIDIIIREKVMAKRNS